MEEKKESPVATSISPSIGDFEEISIWAKNISEYESKPKLFKTEFILKLESINPEYSKLSVNEPVIVNFLTTVFNVGKEILPNKFTRMIDFIVYFNRIIIRDEHPFVINNYPVEYINKMLLFANNLFLVLKFICWKNNNHLIFKVVSKMSEGLGVNYRWEFY